MLPPPPPCTRPSGGVAPALAWFSSQIVSCPVQVMSESAGGGDPGGLPPAAFQVAAFNSVQHASRCQLPVRPKGVQVHKKYAPWIVAQVCGCMHTLPPSSSKPLANHPLLTCQLTRSDCTTLQIMAPSAKTGSVHCQWLPKYPTEHQAAIAYDIANAWRALKGINVTEDTVSMCWLWVLAVLAVGIGCAGCGYWLCWLAAACGLCWWRAPPLCW
jgi:hypothetical protein